MAAAVIMVPSTAYMTPSSVATAVTTARRGLREYAPLWEVQLQAEGLRSYYEGIEHCGVAGRVGRDVAGRRVTLLACPVGGLPSC